VLTPHDNVSPPRSRGCPCHYLPAPGGPSVAARGAKLQVRINDFHIHRVRNREVVDSAAWRHPKASGSCRRPAPFDPEHEFVWLNV
jgi:hypothetical protein